MTPRFGHRLRARYSDCDPQGAVFNANYLTYFDIAMTELWREAFGSYGAMTESGVDMVVAEARVRYLAPIMFDDEVEIGLEIASLGNTSMTTRLVIERDGERVAEGELRHVFIDMETRTKTAIPDQVRRGLEPYSGREEAAA